MNNVLIWKLSLKKEIFTTNIMYPKQIFCCSTSNNLWINLSWNIFKNYAWIKDKRVTSYPAISFNKIETR